MSISVSHIDKWYGKQQVLKDVSFTIGEHEIVAFLGRNGAGKSTTMKIITGYLPADSGAVSVCGLDVAHNVMETKKLIGYLPEHNPLYLDMYVVEYLDFIGQIRRLNGRRKKVSDVIERVGLTKEYKKRIGELSKGYRQRVGLAQAIIHDPRVLILDEPMTGLDPSQLVEIRHLIKTLGEEKTVLFSTHIMQEVESLCDRTIVISDGKIVANGTLADIEGEGTQSETFLVEFASAFNDWEQVSKSIVNVEQVGESKYMVTATEDVRPQLFNYAKENGLVLLTMNRVTKGLEETFVEMTQK